MTMSIHPAPVTEACPAKAALPEALAQRYLPRIQRQALRLARRLPRHILVGDLVSAGFMGLMDAFIKCDGARQDDFDAYVDHRIRGAMLDELRTMDPLTRDQRSFSRKLATARQMAANETGSAPSEDHVARSLGIPLATYHSRLSNIAALAARTSAIPYEEDCEDAFEPANDRPDHLCEQRQNRGRVTYAIDQLPERQQFVLRQYYDEDRTLREIGAMLGVTESRVSQIHSQAIARLRDLIPQD